MNTKNILDDYVLFREKLEKIIPNPVIKNGPSGGGSYFNYLEKPDNGKCVTYELFSGKNRVATFDLVNLIGCCGVVISTAAMVFPEFQKRGINTILNQLRIALAKDFGFGVILCTDRIRNIPERKILKKNGWKDVYTFRNPRTGNDLAISIFDLTQLK